MKTCMLVGTLAQAIPEMNCDYIGVDKGALILARHHIMMEAAVGDFDSIAPEDVALVERLACRTIRLNPIKDVSDMMSAIDLARQMGYERIIMCGVLGGRADHHYVNERLVIMNPDLEIIELHNAMRIYGKGTYNISKSIYDYISFFPIETSVVTLTNFKYPLERYIMQKDDLIGLSNEVLDGAVLTVHQGKLLCIRSSDNKQA